MDLSFAYLYLDERKEKLFLPVTKLTVKEMGWTQAAVVRHARMRCQRAASRTQIIKEREI